MVGDPGGDAGAGEVKGNAGGSGSGGDGYGRGPQSVQSVPTEQMLCSEPGPPSSQSPSLAQLHVVLHMTGVGEVKGNAGGSGDGYGRGPQSVQSVPIVQT